ncbi:serine-rich adhesin for platelets-like [Physella acuta]|uniref:serine-rich adhesin for platelets-like n=1 Tax=Physella acuta TaxID=109671 RepID=UPI0027DCC2B7|nr:serine-rich adhesin for platelets-like [Physella acuta]
MSKDYLNFISPDDLHLYTSLTSLRPVTQNRQGIGKINNAPTDKSGSSRGHPPPSEPPWSPFDPRQPSRPHERYHDNYWPSTHGQPPKDNFSGMNRRRSDGQYLSSSPSGHHQQQRQLLVTTKSSPNLAKPDVHEEDEHVSPRAPTHIVSTKSSPNLLDDLGGESRHLDLDQRLVAPSSMTRSSSDYNVKQGMYTSNSGRPYNPDMYNPDMYSPDIYSPDKKLRHSLPSHSLQRYQPDYENVNTLVSAPLRSEKISEIDDIDEVTGRDSNPQSPETKPYNPLGGAGLPTRDPASLKYIKVNQNHEKYPSWPVTKPNGASEQTQPINTRAQSMTDNTNTSKEFPQKQRLAYTPGLRPLQEKNSPVAERKGDDGKGRNTSDPGLKSEFVYDNLGRVIRRKYDNNEDKFEEFYKNSVPGYPPPKMDPDGHNFGDKEYNAPSPPERETKGIDKQELSSMLGNIGEQGSQREPGPRPVGSSQFLSSSMQNVRPSNLNIKNENLPYGQNTRVDSGTSPLDASPMDKNFQSSSQRDNRFHSDALRPKSWQDPYKQSPPSWQERNYQDFREPKQPTPNSAPNNQSPGYSNLRSSYPFKNDSVAHSERPAESAGSPGLNVSRDKQQPSDKNRPYIVKSTPYYNTSTQTEMMPYAIKMSNPSSLASKLRNAETQVGEFGTQTSPKSADDNSKMFEEKSIQARMSRDFQPPDSEFDRKFPKDGGKTEDVFKYPFVSKSTPFSGIQDIQAKYATDESLDTGTASASNKNGFSSLGDNSASILRKLSEEFYGNRLGMMPEKRMSSASSQEASPRPDPAANIQQPGMREAESYSSVVIHHDVASGLFGRDDFGSVSSIADSTAFSEPNSSFKNNESRTRRSLDPIFTSQKARFQQHDPRVSSSVSGLGHHRELSAPSSTSYNPLVGSQLSPSTSTKPYNFPVRKSADAAVFSSHSKSGSSDSRSTNSGSITSTSESPIGPGGQLPSSSTSTSGQPKPADDVQRKRLDSDSVFVTAEDDLPDYEFNRKPSMRKAYGIYDETERLISQNKLPAKASDSASQPDGNTYVPMSRVSKFSDSLGLGLIQEESDNPNLGEDHSSTVVSGSEKLNSGVRTPSEKVDEKKKYPWQNEAWLKKQADVSKMSNLKRTTSEQIPVIKTNASFKLSSYDTDSGRFQNPDHAKIRSFPGPSPAFINYKNNQPAHARTHSEDLSQSESDLKRRQQQALLSFYQRKTHEHVHARDFSTDSSMYESIESTNSSESVADIISKANENLAKSAQRVDSIRRSNSSSSRGSADYMDMGKSDNRLRRETEWSRLRSSGSLRYSPDHDRYSRSNRSSFASENHYEDISMFTQSTRRDSIAESMDINVDPSTADASMDSGLVASPTYQNFPSKRRTPPPVPRTPSPDSTPPALPPRKYREAQQNADNKPSNAQEAPRSPVSPNEKSRITVIPLGKQLDDPAVENVHRDFKSLRSQWENSSPREDKYAAELRKQAQRLSGQQHPSATPMTVLMSKPKTNIATTFMREPALPQEAVSPASNAPATSYQPPNLPTTSYQPSNISTTSYQPPNLPTTSYQPPNLSTTSYQPPNLSTTRPTNEPANSPGSVTNKSIGQSSSPPQPTPPPSTGRAFALEDTRSRSSSELVTNHHGGAGQHGVKTIPYALRDRSASDHDVLSDRRQRQHPHETHFGASPEGLPVAVTQWRNGRGPGEGEDINRPDTGYAAHAEDDYVDSLEQDGFAEGSYIGHKNKKTRAIGTYQRSKSAAVLPDNGADSEEQKLGQQSWNSESVLTHTDSKDDGDSGAVSSQESLVSATVAPPVRPARPSLQARQAGHPTGGASTLPAVEQQTWDSRRPLTDPRSFDPGQQPGQWSDQGQYEHENQSYRWPSEDGQRAQSSNGPVSQYSPQRRSLQTDPRANSLKTSSPSSSQDYNNYTRDFRADEELPPMSLPPRDYQRRESAPVKPMSSASSPENKLTVVTDTSRRRSDSSVQSSARSDHSGSDVSAGHSRQPSQEELECDEKAKQLAQELEDKDQKLSDVLRLDVTKKRMQYMDGLFSESMDAGSGFSERPGFNHSTRSSLKTSSPQHQKLESSLSDPSKRNSLPKEYYVSTSKAKMEMELRKNEEVGKVMTRDITDSNALMKQKEELIDKLHKKLEVLKEEKAVLQQEIAENEQLGKEVLVIVETKCQSQSEKDKFKTYIDDLEKIVRLLLNLSGQLARAENALQALPANVDAKIKKMTEDKRERLSAKHEEAKLLKDDIDKRSDQLSLVLRERLDHVEFSDYTHYIKMKSKLTIDLQELDDKITLGGEQIQELKKSIPDRSAT